MKSRVLILAMCIFFIGLIVCISSFINMITHKSEINYPIQFISACLLMICSALLMARSELIQIESRIKGKDIRDELDARVRGLEGKRDRVSSWKFSDLEYRVAELEEKVS